MSNINTINPSDATPQVQDQLNAVQKKLGATPNIFTTMAHSPATLSFYLAGSEALAKSTLSAKLREQIALTVAQYNNCQYCLAAHSAIGKSLGLSEEAIKDARLGHSPNAKTEAILIFAQLIVKNQGKVTPESFAHIRKEGAKDNEITEIIAVVAHNIFSNYFNIASQTEIDFPKAQCLDNCAA